MSGLKILAVMFMSASLLYASAAQAMEIRQFDKMATQDRSNYVATVLFKVGESNWRSQRAMEKIGGIRRDGLVSRPSAGGPHVVYEITKAGFRL